MQLLNPPNPFKKTGYPSWGRTLSKDSLCGRSLSLLGFFSCQSHSRRDIAKLPIAFYSLNWTRLYNLKNEKHEKTNKQTTTTTRE